MNTNNTEKEKEKILKNFKENRFKEVVSEGNNLLNQRQNDAQLIYMLGLSSIHIQDFVNAEKYFEGEYDEAELRLVRVKLFSDLAN